MKLKVKYRGKFYELDINKEKVTALDILKALNLSSEYAFVVKNGEVVPEEELINETDDIKVVNAISGG
ncbi:MAG: MoaD/ThiS family protein [Aquificae bacterium]|nr:MoaD/ThiS family protein [Aquificota bacterium]